MTEQILHNFIANYETEQKQKYALFLRQIKSEFYQLRLEQRRQRMHSHHSQQSPIGQSLEPQSKTLGRGRTTPNSRGDRR